MLQVPSTKRTLEMDPEFLILREHQHDDTVSASHKFEGELKFNKLHLDPCVDSNQSAGLVSLQSLQERFGKVCVPRRSCYSLWSTRPRGKGERSVACFHRPELDKKAWRVFMHRVQRTICVLRSETVFANVAL